MYALADHVANQVYFASGAFNEKRSGDGEEDDTARDPAEVARFFQEGRDLLTELAQVEFINIAHDVLKTLEFLIPQDPAGVFRLIHQSIMAAQRDVQERQGGLTRAVLTNGDWWVVILDPVTALKPGPDGAPTDLVRVYESPERVLDLAEELGSLLLYSKVARSAEPVFVDQILFCVDPTLIVGMSFGVRVLHVVDVKSWDLQVPRVEVAPVLFLHAQGGGRLAVVGDSADAVLPGARPTKLRQHLKAVERSARRLRREVERVLALRLFTAPATLARTQVFPT